MNPEFESDILNCLKVLNEGGIILYPTDTIWGIGCDATNTNGVNKIFDLKQRNAGKALVILVSGEKDVLRYAAHVDLKIFSFLATTKKPTTVIYDGAIGLADNLVAEDGSVAMRIVNDDFCKTLIRRFRKPIVSTSANLSGESSPANFKDVNESLKQQVDYVVKYRQQDAATALSSSIIKWNRDGSIITLRE